MEESSSYLLSVLLIAWLKLVKCKLRDRPCLGYAYVVCTTVAHGPK